MRKEKLNDAYYCFFFRNGSFEHNRMLTNKIKEIERT